MIAAIVFGLIAVIWLVLCTLMTLDQFKIWQNKVGRTTWKVWTWIFPFFLLWGTFSWWYHPIWFGPIIGRIFAAFLTFVTFQIFREMWRKYRKA